MHSVRGKSRKCIHLDEFMTSVSDVPASSRTLSGELWPGSSSVFLLNMRNQNI